MGIDTQSPPEPSDCVTRHPGFSRTPSWRRSIERFGVAVLLIWFLIAGFLPAWRVLNTDFPNYWLAASLHRDGISLERAYEWVWFQRQKDHLQVDQPLVGFMPNPPAVAAPMLPLTSMSPLTAKRTWLALSVILLIVTAGMIRRTTVLSWTTIWFTSLLCVYPLRLNFICGQYYIVILTLICSAYYAYRSGNRFAAGGLIATAASLKLFPALFLILLLRKRDWHAVLGFMVTLAVLTVSSILIFGWPVHYIWLVEVLPRALHGDIIDPYAIEWGSFSALWHRLFLVEPELNPAPFWNSQVAYAVCQALTTSLLLFSFLSNIDQPENRKTEGLEWACLVSLMLLLSPMPSPYHYCVLIFATVIGLDAFLRRRDTGKSVALLSLFAITCVPPEVTSFYGRYAFLRLIGTFGIYVLLLVNIASRKAAPPVAKWAIMAVGLVAILFVSNLRSVRNRSQDFPRRIATHKAGYAYGQPVGVGSDIVFAAMQDNSYSAIALEGNRLQQLPFVDDVLSIGGTTIGPTAYFEIASRQSIVAQFSLSSDGLHTVIAQGQQPVMSANGAWLAYLQEEGTATTIWVRPTTFASPPRELVRTSDSILEFTVADSGDVIAALGDASNPTLAWITQSGSLRPLVAGPARFPAISPDGMSLAYSRRKRGSWQLSILDLTTGVERGVTDAPCNATQAFWEDNDSLLYATDCGRGLGLSAIARMSIPRN